MTAKRTDYFEAGTVVVWDVDPRTHTVRSYRAASPATPPIFTADQIADAEPAVPGWTLAVERIFAGSSGLPVAQDETDSALNPAERVRLGRSERVRFGSPVEANADFGRLGRVVMAGAGWWR